MKHRYLYLGLSFFVLTTLTFAYLLKLPFFYDDGVIIGTNDLLRTFRSVPDILKGQIDVENQMNGSYRPLLMIWTMILGKVTGFHANAMRIFGFLLHSVNATLLFYFLRRYLTLSVFVSTLTVLVFLLHPIQTTSLAMVWKQSDLWIAFFALISILFWTQKKWMPWVLVLIFTLALGFKESAVILPFIWLCLWIVKKHRDLLLLAVILLLAILSGVYLKFVHGFLPPAQVTEDGNPFSGWIYFLTQLHVLPMYLKTLVFPPVLTLDRTISMTLEAGLYEYVVIGGLSGLGLWCFWNLFSKNRHIIPVFISALWLVPTSSFYPLSLLYDETRMYLVVPWIFLVLFIPLEIALSTLKPFYHYGVIVLAIILMSFIHFPVQSHWSSEEAIWLHSTVVDECAARAHFQLGQLYENELALDDAEQEYRNALLCTDQIPQAKLQLGVVLGKKGSLVEAAKIFDEVTQSQSPFFAAKAFYYLGLNNFYRKRTTKAKQYFRKSHELSPQQGLCEKGFKVLYPNTQSDPSKNCE